ncbi:2432_t:CDS:10 [Diversispora eburnea]|uniref:2432_t:CDS:1 n=1 Tax=Diversispora eburnea TaxID=1213867 RepID=A0A9N8VX47_9GLOM|nr:2432_t:CDS:10 [Diversispora eburnea]
MESGGLPIDSGFPLDIIKSLPPYEDFIKRKNEQDDDDNANEEPQHQFTLRIYSLGDNTSIMSMEEAIFKTAGMCLSQHQSISLSFVPMQLYHTKIKINGESKVGLLLSGTDGRIHLYLENKDNPMRWEEESVRPYFPSLSSLLDSNSNCVSILEIQEINDLKIIAAGCQNGILFISIMKFDIETNEYVQLEGPSSVALFCPITSITIFSSFTSEVNPSDIHLLVTCAVEQAIVYCVLCSHVMDVDWDGRNEIIIGTYGREMLIYKQEINEDPNSIISFKLIHQQSFTHPIYSINGIYLNQDGIDELIVSTQYGVHILQPNLNKAKEVLVKRLKNLEKLRQEYHHLESTVVNDNNNDITLIN